MSDLVPSEDIETIVGVLRHPFRHFARADSATQTVYILHPTVCREDLRNCIYSQALDKGIDETFPEDHPLHVTVSWGRLAPCGQCELPYES